MVLLVLHMLRCHWLWQWEYLNLNGSKPRKKNHTDSETRVTLVLRFFTHAALPLALAVGALEPECERAAQEDPHRFRSTNQIGLAFLHMPRCHWLWLWEYLSLNVSGMRKKIHTDSETQI